MTPTLGFASNLSHTIIREAQEDDDHSTKSHDSDSTNISISDEELALLGAPWAKEGMLCRKQFWEATGKKAKARSWMDVFVVIQRGEMNMFTFGDRTSGGSGVVGGGNWLVIALFLSLSWTMLIARTGKRAISWHPASGPFTGTRTSPSRIQQATPALYGVDACERRRLLLSSWYRGVSE
jgi:hypothetical protein